MYYIRTFIGSVFVVCVLCGCGQHESQAVTDVKPAEVSFNHDQGVVEGDFRHDFVVTGRNGQVVKSVHSSCGCAIVSVKAGDRFDAESVVSVAVSPKGGSGKVSRELIVKFTDGDDLRLGVSYDFQPLPFAAPEYVVFRSQDPTKLIKIMFPGEQFSSVSAEPQECSRLSCKLLTATDNEMEVQVDYNFEGFKKPEEGVIVIGTGSARRPTVRVPFLALQN